MRKVLGVDDVIILLAVAGGIHAWLGAPIATLADRVGWTVPLALLIIGVWRLLRDR